MAKMRAAMHIGSVYDDWVSTLSRSHLSPSLPTPSMHQPT
jgi:hypothetical protein